MTPVEAASDNTCVVIDCNEWIRLKWLGSPIGVTFLSTLKRNLSLRLAIPEVLNTELDKHRTRMARELLQKLKEVTSEINTITGDSIAAGIVTLTEESIEVAIRGRLSGIASQTIYPAMSLAEAKQALERVNNDTPPNSPKNQQMKDSLLWEACVSLAEDYRVVFVTGDTAFYRDRKPKNGLADNLASEVVVKNGRLRVFSTLEEAMQSFAPEASVDSDEISKADSRILIAAQAEKAFAYSSMAIDLRVRVKLRGVVPSYFRTDIAYIFAVSFTAFFNIEGGVEDDMEGEAAISGECKLNTRGGAVEEVSLQSIHWTLRYPDGYVVKSHEILTIDRPD
ncbi:PIN domain-containing protein [Streptosporangium sp. V21-05]|uniref:PIN domain-containing protein n=1 Tax=Streptosporangium sp. V21-05 TaxID=3446115 RepID=UPI003F53D95D